MKSQDENKRGSATGVRILHLIQARSYIVAGIQLIFVLDGKLRVQTSSDECRLGVSDILLINHSELVRLLPTGHCYFVDLRIGPSFLKFAFCKDNLAEIPHFVCNPSAGDSGMFDTIRNAIAEIAYLDVNRTESVNGMLFHSRLLRLLNELSNNFTYSPPDESDNKRLRDRKILTYLQANFQYPLKLPELAEEFSLSPQYLSRYFKTRFGMNFHACLNQMRLENAIKDMDTTDASITSIVYNNGFSTLFAFTKALKQKTGQTPTEYRRNNMAKAVKVKLDGEDAVGDIDLEFVRTKIYPYLDAGSLSILPYPIKTRAIDVDCRTGKAYKRPWAGVINMGFARDFIKYDLISQITMIQNETPFLYARFQGIFDKSMIFPYGDRADHGFTQIDRLIDSLYSVNLIPFVELGAKPDKISKNADNYLFTYDKETESVRNIDYANVLDSFLKHAVNRYGLDEINRWRFEYWAPLDGYLPADSAKLEKYIDQFIDLRNIIKNIAPLSLVGGPGIDMTYLYFKENLETVLYLLREKNIGFDFFSFYVFSHEAKHIIAGDESKANVVLWEKDEILKKISWIKERILSSLPDIKLFYITEWNIDFSCRNMIHDSILKAPFILQNAIDTIDNIDILAYWLASDISAEYHDSDAVLFGGAGLISRHSICKPSFFAYQFLSKLGDRLLAKGDGYIVTVKKENEYVAIVFNYKYINNQSKIWNHYRDVSHNINDCLEDTHKLAFSVTLNNIQGGRYKIRQHILNSYHGDVYSAWEALCPAENLHPSEIAWLKQTCIPLLQIEFINTTGKMDIICDLEPNEVRLLEISLILE
jgi:beta-xylosidase/AraC-like DNA-binding protein